MGLPCSSKYLHSVWSGRWCCGDRDHRQRDRLPFLFALPPPSGDRIAAMLPSRTTAGAFE